MAARYLLKVVTEFASAHTLRDYPGACSRMHGHNWKLELEVAASQLDEIGMGIDFKQMKAAANEVGERLDHRYLNDLEPFTEMNPTAENIARYIFACLLKSLGPACPLAAVHVKEAPGCVAGYLKPDVES